MNTNNNVFISGLPRSGSTILGMMLNQHSSVFHAGESWYWGNLDPKDTICSCGATNCKILRHIADNINEKPDILIIRETIIKLDHILENKYDQNTQLNIGKIDLVVNGLEQLFKLYREIIGKPTIIDKSGNIILGKSILHRKDWKVIFLTRDPRGIIYSNKKSSIRHNKDFDIGIKIEAIRNHIAILNGLIIDNGNLCIIRYEDLCINPRNSLVKICDYLGISFDESMLKFRKDKGHILMANRTRLGNDEAINEDIEWIEGLTEVEKEKIMKQKDILSFYNNIGYNI